MRVGAIKLGTPVPTQGRIRDLNIYAAGPGGVEATYTHEGAIPGKHQAITYVNGEFAAVDTDEVSGASGMDEGNQNVTIIPQLANQQISRIRFDDSYGSRVLLEWAQVTGAISGYNIYAYDGSDYTLAGNVTTREIIGAQLELPSTGTGTGRISIPATPLPDTINDVLTITITDTGEAEWALGVLSGTIDFARGTVATLAHNILVSFEDDPDAYQTGDEWSFPAGVTTNWTSPDLPPGEYQYAVAAYNAAGTESTKVLSQIYEIQTLPDPVTPTESWNYATDELTISYAIPAGASGVAVYHNFLPQEGIFADHVSNIRAVQAGSTSLVIDFTGIAGTLKYYLRPYTASGLELPDFTLYEIEIPVPSGALGTPINVTAEPYSVQQWRAEWEYPVQENDGLSKFTIHRVTHGNAFDYSTDIAGEVTLTESLMGSGYNIAYDFTMEGDTTPAGEIDIQIVAHTSSGNVRYSDIVTITTYALDAPSAPSAIIGGAV